MTANTLCFISSKGGSGKTVTSSSLGTFLAALEYKVLLVDTDAATNGMTLLYLEQLLGRRRQNIAANQAGVGLFEATQDSAPSPIEISDTLHLVPASFTMSDTEATDHLQFEEALKILLRTAENYDFVLLDAQAGTDSYAKTAASFADQCVIVSEYDPVSAQGIERLKILFSKVMSPSSTWVLFNKILPEFAAVIGEGLSVARYLTPIPWDADVVRAFVRRDLAINMNTPNPYTLAISQIAYSLFPDETGEAIEKWRGSTLQSVTTPVVDRLRELEMIEMRLDKEKARRDLFLRFVSLSTAGIGTAAAVATTLSISDIVFPIKQLFENKDAIFPGLALFATVVATVGIMLAAYLGRFIEASKSRTEEMTLELLHDEQAKLKATLNAAEGALKFSRDAGYYERRRRAPSRTE